MLSLQREKPLSCWPLALLTGLLLVLSGVLASPAIADGEELPQAADASRPNVVLIQTDDQALDDLYATFRTVTGNRVPVMRATLNKLARRGITFRNYYATFPTCCPSRSALLTGQYNHNNGVRGNVGPDGGWPAFRRSPAYRENLAVWLQRAGYRTIHIGKFLNQYGSAEKPETTVPPGWDEWQTNATDLSNRQFYGYRMNENGRIGGPFGSRDYGLWVYVDPYGCLRGPADTPWCNHQTDAVTRRAVEQIGASAADGRPFYLQVDYIAPHGDHRPPIGPEPTPRNYGRAANTPVPRGPAFDELNVNDKPSFIRELPGRISQREKVRMRTEYQRTLESLRDVDDGVRSILQALYRNGVLKNTYVVFISDNGFFRGQHRLARGKILPYEASARVPLLIRGPGIKRNSETGELAANIDLAPTILRLAGATPGRPVDGRSLARFWEDTSLRTRRPLVIESFATKSDAETTDKLSRWSATAYMQYRAIRFGQYKFVLYENGETELYDLFSDPHELRNRSRNLRFARLKGFLRRQLERYAECEGQTCRMTGDLPPIPGVANLNLRWGPRR